MKPEHTISIDDVVRLIEDLSRGTHSETKAVAKMMRAARHGQSIDVDAAHLSVDWGVLSRVLEAVGNAPSPRKGLI